MDWVLLILGIVLLLLGIIGCVLPVIPGPPISYVSLLVLHFSKFAEISTQGLIVYATLAIIVTVLDYIVPVWGTKKFGGSKKGVTGSIIGLIVGIIVLPLLGIVIGPFGIIGILLGPFLGAYIGETIDGKQSEEATKAAIGSFLGFVAGTVMKLTISLLITFVFVKEIWQFVFKG